MSVAVPGLEVSGRNPPTGGHPVSGTAPTSVRIPPARPTPTWRGCAVAR